MDSEMSHACFELLGEEYLRDHFCYISQSGVSSLPASAVRLEWQPWFNTQHRFGRLSSVMWMVYNAVQLAGEFPELLVH